MGTICHRKQQELKNYSTKTISFDSSKQSQKIKITTKNINKTHENCLLVFIDRQCNVRRNQHLNQIKDTIGTKVQDYLDLQIKGKIMNPGDCLIIQIKIDGLKFEHIVFLCINIWQVDNKNAQDPLQEDIEHALQTISQKKLNNLCITFFNPQFGIPQQISFKALSRAVLNKTKDFDSISIVCSSEEQQNFLIKVINQQQNKRLEGLKKSSISNSIKSDYF